MAKIKKLKPEKLQTLDAIIEKPFDAKQIFLNVKTEVLNGFTNIKKAYLYFHQHAVILDMFKKDADMKEALQNEISRDDETPFYNFIFKNISKKNYLYSELNDEELQKIEAQIEELEKKKMKRQNELREIYNVPIRYINYVEVSKAA